jgi:taurine dioxygenase
MDEAPTIRRRSMANIDLAEQGYCSDARPGFEVHDVDLNCELEWPRLLAPLYRHHVIVVKRQRLSPALLVEFGKFWGEPQHFSRTLPGFSEILLLNNSPDRPAADRDDAMHWHHDGSYDPQPSNVTILYARDVPREGGATLFSNTVAAYDTLDDVLKVKIDGLVARHEIFGGKAAADEYIPPRRPRPPSEAPVIHPLVARHPITGRRSLYGVSGTPVDIVGMSAKASEEVLSALKAHATSSQFRAECKAEADDVIIWDNYAVMHRATPIAYSVREGEARLLYRMSMKGEAPHPGEAALVPRASE